MVYIIIILLALMFVPYRIERKKTRAPWVTFAFILICTFAWSSTVDYWLVISSQTVRDWAFVWGPRATYTWLTSMFLHADVMHLLGNMWYLWLFGCFVEEAIGSVRFAVLYLAGGIVAALTQTVAMAAFAPDSLSTPLVGASGAIAAVMGLFMVRFYRTRVRVFTGPFVLFGRRFGFLNPPAFVAIAVWFGFQLLFGFTSTSSVAYWAHIGGLVLGMGVGLLTRAKSEADTEIIADEASEWARSGSYAVAAAKFEQLVERRPDDPEALLGEARALFGTFGADKEKGAQDLKRAVEILVGARSPERVVLAWDEMHLDAADAPIDAKTLSTIASLAEARERHDLASEAYWRVVQEHGESREAERALFRLAHVYLAAHMESEAQDCWNRFRTAYPTSEWHAFADPAFGVGA